MKTVLLLGSSGFIGRNLKEQLNYNLLSPLYQELNLIDDMKVRDFFIENEVDCIIHCASKEDKDCLEPNIRMFLNLIKYRKENCKLIYFGSGAEQFYSTPYAVSKKVINDITKLEPNVFNLRLYGVFGKYEDEKRRFLSVCCKAILNKKPIEIWDNLKIDYLYINDLVKIVEWFIENNPRQKEYDICTSSPLYLSDWADTLMHNVGEKTNVILHKTNPLCYSGCNGDFLDEFPFKFTPIEQSLKELYDYYRTR